MATDPWAGFEEVAAPAAQAYPGVIPGRAKTPDAPTPLQIKADARADASLGLAQEAAVRAKEAADRADKARIPEGASAGIQENLKTLRALDDALSGLKGRPQSIGPGTGMLGDYVTQYNDPKGTGVRSVIGAVGAYKIHDLSGAAVSAAEAPRFTPFVPSVTDRPEVAEAKLKKFRQALELQIAEQLDYYTPANGYRPYVTPAADEFRRSLTGGPDGPIKTDASGNPIEVTVTDDAGLTGSVTDDSPDPNDGGKSTEPHNTFLGSVGDIVEAGASVPGIIVNPLGQALYNATGYGATKYDLGTIIREGLDLPRNPDGLVRNLNTFTASAMAGGGLARGASMLTKPGLAREVLSTLGESPIRDAAAGTGGALGAYYGEKVGGAPGAVAGGVLGAVAAHGGAGALVRSPRPVNAATAALRDAGEAEGVTVNRAMVDPTSNNRVSGVDATMGGGPRLQRGMRQVEGQFEGRVQALGRDGRPMLNSSGEPDQIALGDTVKRAGERSIAETGKIAKRKYDRAERLAGDARVTPKESLARVEAMIGKLGETPETNAAEISFLEKIRSDLSNDLSVGGLRRMRTSLRKKISKGDLVYGEDEANVLAIMDGAADDIRAGLAAQGKSDAASAFDAADKAYRARMEYVTGTVQNLLGKRNAALSSEDIAKRFTSMAAKDARGLRKFYATLTPEESADVAATFAERLGTNAKDGFSVAQFMRQTSSKNMSDEAARTMFGAEGLASIRNLRTLGREIERVTGAMNSRTSKTAPAANYRQWLTDAILGGGGAAVLQGANGGVTMGTAATGIAAGAATVGVKALRDTLSARALMSPKITKWLTEAPRTTDPKAINAHFARLGAIAKQEPALAADIQSLQESIMRAANDNAVRSAVASEGEQDQKR
jgi:hypothetical protein